MSPVRHLGVPEPSSDSHGPATYAFARATVARKHEMLMSFIIGLPRKERERYY